MLGSFYEVVCVGTATVNDGGKEKPVIGLSFPIANPPKPDDPEADENYEDVFISIAAAKAMLVDLRDAIEAAQARKPFK
jgi:hypothetical protein